MSGDTSGTDKLQFHAFFNASNSRSKADSSNLQPMNCFKIEGLNYTFEELEILKILAGYPDDPQHALNLISSGLDEYQLPGVRKILAKFYEDGIWDLQVTEDGEHHSIFKMDIRDTIINYRNPIPEEYTKDIDVRGIIEKLSATNLDLSERNYLNKLLKKEIGERRSAILSQKKQL